MIRWLIMMALAAGFATRAEDGSAVVLVYNSSVPASKKVADHYAQMRKVPAAQVIGLPMPDRESISRAEYNSQIAEPLLKKIEELKLLTWKSVSRTDPAGKVDEIKVIDEAKVRYAALCFGVPLKIQEDSSIKEPGSEKKRPEERRNEAAVDNELAGLPLRYAKASIGGPIVNPFYGATNATVLDPKGGLLMVARLDGPTAEIASGLVDKAMQAEREGLWGRAYFDARGLTNGGYKVGDEMILASEKTAARRGFETTVDEQNSVFPASFPMSHIAVYVGWYEFNVTGAMARPTVEFMPGAFAYHLHSFSAQTLRSSSERWVGPLLARGATATMGCTEEPYLEGTPDISIFMGRWMFLGFTFGEAAYASQRFISWQTTVVGDPLYRPFALKPQELHERLVRTKSKLIEWSYLGVVDINLSTQTPPEQLIDFIKTLPETKNSSVLNEKLGDLLKAKGKWIDAMDPYEAALALPTSPQQRLRISLELAPLQTSFGRGKQAYAIYQGLLKDYPDFADKVRIYQKILPLADQFGKPAEAAEYQKALKELTPPPATPPKA